MSLHCETCSPSGTVLVTVATPLVGGGSSAREQRPPLFLGLPLLYSFKFISRYQVPVRLYLLQRAQGMSQAWGSAANEDASCGRCHSISAAIQIFNI